MTTDDHRRADLRAHRREVARGPRVRVRTWLRAEDGRKHNVALDACRPARCGDACFCFWAFGRDGLRRTVAVKLYVTLITQGKGRVRVEILSFISTGFCGLCHVRFGVACVFKVPHTTLHGSTHHGGRQENDLGTPIPHPTAARARRGVLFFYLKTPLDLSLDVL